MRKNRPQQIRLEHDQPIRFGADDEFGVALRRTGELEIVDVAEVGQDALLVHDAHREDPGLAFMLSRLSHTPHGPTPIGLFRQVARPVYGTQLDAQLDDAVARRGRGDLATLLAGPDSWVVR